MNYTLFTLITFLGKVEYSNLGKRYLSICFLWPSTWTIIACFSDSLSCSRAICSKSCERNKTAQTISEPCVTIKQSACSVTFVQITARTIYRRADIGRTQMYRLSVYSWSCMCRIENVFQRLQKMCFSNLQLLNSYPNLLLHCTNVILDNKVWTSSLFPHICQKCLIITHFRAHCKKLQISADTLMSSFFTALHLASKIEYQRGASRDISQIALLTWIRNLRLWKLFFTSAFSSVSLLWGPVQSVMSWWDTSKQGLAPVSPE